MFRELAYSSIAAFARMFADNNPDNLRVLMYHRVDEPTAKPHLAPCTLSATPVGFEQQIGYLARNHTVVSIDDVIAAINGEATLPRSAVLITFDDAYDCFARNAWPVLQAHNMPALLFVASDFPAQRNQRFWWDAIHELVFASNKSQLKTRLGSMPVETHKQKQLANARLTSLYESTSSRTARQMLEELVEENGLAPRENDVLPWEAIRNLVAQGLSVGAHTCSHPLLDQMTSEDAKQEIVGSVEEVRRQTGAEVKTFAYPGGRYNDHSIEMCRQLKLDTAFTTCRGANDVQNDDRFQLRRINVGRRATVTKLQTQLLLRKRWINSFFKSGKSSMAGQRMANDQSS